MQKFDYDLVVIGAGSGGVRAARLAAQLGAHVAIVESTYLGGTCVNVGCIPKKLLSYAAHFHEDFEDAAGFGWSPGHPHFTWSRLIAAKDAEISRLHGVYETLLENAKVRVIHGLARMSGEHTLAVENTHISAKYILVATGGQPVTAPVAGSHHAITSNEVFHLPNLPRHVVIYGGAYVAVEFASIFNGLGAQTTLVFRGEHLLKNFDSELGVHLAREMAKKGVRLRLETRIEKIEARGALRRVTLSDGEEIEADCVLFATGRLPNTQALGLEKLGVELSATGAVRVNANYQSSIPSIFAIGDVIDRIRLTPVALAEGMAVADFLFGPRQRSVSYANVATTVFSHPSVASVGLSEAAALSAGHTLKIYKNRFRALKHTLSLRDEETFIKLVVDDLSDRVLGIHLVGPDAGEIVQGFAVALNCGLTKAVLDATMGIHPTQAEEILTMRETAV